MLPLLILLISFSPVWLFGALIMVVTAIGLFEYYAMSLPESRMLERYLAIGAGTCLLPVFAFGGTGFVLGGCTLIFLVFATLFLFRFKEISTVVTHLALVCFGYLYLSLLLSHMVLLRDLPYGRQWVFLVLLIVMASDSAAYFTGMNFGRRKLYPAISPNKSIEGAIGGLVGGLAGAFLAKALFFPELSIFDALVTGLFAGVLGQIGDLFESMLKRAFGVKDSGTIIPGHGGILDRLDSLLFAFPPVFYYAAFVF